MSTYAQVEASEAAIETLAEDLLEEVFEHAEYFLRDDDSLKNWAIFRWLAEIERETGLVSEATIGTNGSRWLLARQLGDTLQATIDQIVQMTASEQAIANMTQTFLFANLMGLWNMHMMGDDQPFGEILKPNETVDFD